MISARTSLPGTSDAKASFVPFWGLEIKPEAYFGFFSASSAAPKAVANPAFSGKIGGFGTP
jgi:hypothetical protein